MFPGRGVGGFLPAGSDRLAVGTESADEPLREARRVAPLPPFAPLQAHQVDARHPTVVVVERRVEASRVIPVSVSGDIVHKTPD